MEIEEWVILLSNFHLILVRSQVTSNHIGAGGEALGMLVTLPH